MEKLKITEKNFTQNFNQLFFTDNLNLIDTFKHIHNQIIATTTEDSYESIPDNYICLFILESINNQIDTNQFRELIQYLFSSETLCKQLNFYRMFNNSSSIEAWEYTKENRNQQKFTVWEQLHYLFIDTDDDNNKKLYQKNLPYLKIIMEEVNENSIESIHYSNLAGFFYTIKHNIEDIIPLFPIINNNPIYMKDSLADNSYSSFIYKLLTLSSYITTDDPKQLSLNFHKTFSQLTEFKSTFEKNLIAINNNGKFKLDYNMTVLIEEYGFQNTVSLLKNTLSKTLNEISEDHQINLVESTCMLIPISLSKLKYDIKYNSIDTNKNLIYNLVDVLLIKQSLLNNTNNNIIPNNILHYLKIELDTTYNDIEASPSNLSNIHYVNIHYYLENSDIPMSKLIENELLKNSLSEYITSDKIIKKNKI